MAVERNCRYGLNLNLGLSFEGVLTDREHIAQLGDFMLWAVQNPHISNEGASLQGLTGNIVGTAADSHGGVKRKLTPEPVTATFRVTSLDDLNASFGNHCIRHGYGHGSSRTDRFFNLEGMGTLHIPKFELFKKYQRVLPGEEYVTHTPPGSVVDDIFSLNLDYEDQLQFAITVDPFNRSNN